MSKKFILPNFKLSDLQDTARYLGLNYKNKNKTKLISLLRTHKQTDKYRLIKQTGYEGRDGIVFIVQDEKGKKYALKQFKQDKSINEIKREINFQIRASQTGISPKIRDFSLEEKYIVMDKMDIDLLTVYTKQAFNLTLDQQRKFIHILKTLDSIGIFHADPNPLNFMFKGEKLFIIDFGLAKEIDNSVIEKSGNEPNLREMPIGFILKIFEQYPQVKFSYIETFLN